MRVRAKIDVVLRLDLARRRNRRGQILPKTCPVWTSTMPRSLNLMLANTPPLTKDQEKNSRIFHLRFTDL